MEGESQRDNYAVPVSFIILRLYWGTLKWRVGGTNKGVWKEIARQQVEVRMPPVSFVILESYWGTLKWRVGGTNNGVWKEMARQHLEVRMLACYFSNDHKLLR